MSLSRFENIVKRISHPRYTIKIAATKEFNQPYLQVRCVEGICNKTGEPIEWGGRKFMLSKVMLDEEVVQTAFLAMKIADEHELREQFLFDGASIFDPHWKLEMLVDLRKKEGSTVERPSPVLV